jgi:hypothetical protein
MCICVRICRPSPTHVAGYLHGHPELTQFPWDNLAMDYLKASAALGTTGALALMDLIPNTVDGTHMGIDIEQLSGAGLIVAGAFFMIRWFMAELKVVREDAKLDRSSYMEHLKEKDEELKILNEGVRAILVQQSGVLNREVAETREVKVRLTAAIDKHNNILQRLDLDLRESGAIKKGAS